MGGPLPLEPQKGSGDVLEGCRIRERAEVQRWRGLEGGRGPGGGQSPGGGQGPEGFGIRERVAVQEGGEIQQRVRVQEGEQGPFNMYLPINSSLPPPYLPTPAISP